MKNFKKEILNCGCCGTYFETWPEYEDQDQDAGFGICKKCQDWSEKKIDETFEDAKEMIYKNLTPERQEQFNKLDKEKQNWFISELINKGILKWEIKK